MRLQVLIVSLLISCFSATAVVVTDYDPLLLSSNLFTDITRDQRGYLWISTEYGLNKFDGVRFTSYYGDYNREGDLYTSRVVRLFADTATHAPSLWVLFYGALQYYDATRDKFEHVDISLIPNPALTAIFRHNGTLLLHAKNSGLWQIERVDGIWKAFPYESSYPLPSNIEGRYSTDQQWWDEAHQSVYFRDKDGTIWQGERQQRLKRISPYEHGATYIPINQKWSNGQPLYSCLVAPSGNFYVAQIDNGLRCLNREGHQIAPTLLPGLTGSCTLELRNGSTIIGTTNHGLFLYQRHGNEYQQVAHATFSSNKVKSLVEAEDGIVYVGLMEGKMVLFDTHKRETREVEGYVPTNIYVNKLALDSNGILWIGHYAGIDLYDTKNHCMIDNHSWYESTSSVAHRLLTAAVYDIHFHDNKTYIASNKGLFVYDTNWHCYTMEDGLPSNVICRILQDEDHNLWMSTFRGISMFSPTDHPTFINYYLGDGMQAACYIRGAGAHLPTGELLFPDNNGVTIITPQLLVGKPFTQPIVLSNLYMSGVRVTPQTRSNQRLVTTGAVDESQELSFSYLDNVITMQFSPLDMRDNRNVCYLYRFADEQYDGWHSTLPGESSITFSRLGYGRHVLMVRARDGIEYSKIARWIIYIVPPMYLRWWAIMMYILVVLGGVMYVIYTYHRSKEQQLLREQLQFYINKSHEIPLTLTVELKGNDKLLMEKMMEHITAHIDDSEMNVETIADAVGVSRAQLQRRVKQITGTSVGAFVRELRLKQAAQLLLKGDVNIAQVSYTVGFNAPNVFSSAFKKYFGMSPKEYIARNTNQ